MSSRIKFSGFFDEPPKELEKNNTFDLDQIVNETVVDKVYHKDTLPSTSDWAREIANDPNLPSVCLFLTNVQTQGRGRGQKTWLASRGSLTFSLLISPADYQPFSHSRLLPLAVGISVCESIENVLAGEHCLIKWPNDVYLQDRKICGCLVESFAGPKSPLVIGCGINVNNPHVADLNGISMCQVSRRSVPLNVVLIDVVNRIGAMTRSLDKHAGQVVNELRNRNWLAGHHITVSHGENCQTGRVVDISDAGGLVVKTADGEVEFQSGSVHYVD